MLNDTSSTSPSKAIVKKDIWTLIREDKEREKKSGNDDQSGYETVFLVIGSKNSGKTTLIYRFLERDDNPSPTLGLEYTYGRKTRGIGGIKDVTHIWELAGGTQLSDLIEIPLTEANIHTATLAITVDLSEPSVIVSTVERSISKITNRINSIFTHLEKRGSKRPKGLKSHAWKKYGGEGTHPDNDMLNLLPIPAVIVGCKYDVFRDFEPEHRKLITRILRYIAHTHGASLLYVSNKDETLVMRFRQLTSYHAFRTNPPRGLSTDFNKPIFILAGSDTLSQISSSAFDESGAVGTMAKKVKYENWKNDLEKWFPPKTTAEPHTDSNSITDDIDTQKFQLELSKYPEPEIDRLRAQKDDELDRYRAARDRASGANKSGDGKKDGKRGSLENRNIEGRNRNAAR